MGNEDGERVGMRPTGTIIGPVSFPKLEGYCVHIFLLFC